MSKHTPVRLHGKGWRADHTNGGEFVPLLGSQGEWLADIRSNGDFHKFVVTALNAHYDLLEALRDWLYYADNALSEFDVEGDAECDPEGDLCPRCEVAGCIQRKIRNARAALAKAQSPAGEPR